MKLFSILCSAVAVNIASFTPVLAAVIYTETFSSSVASWQAVGDGSLAYAAASGNPGGALEIALDPDGLPLNAGFMANVSASGGSFAGNYTDINAANFMFDFYSSVNLNTPFYLTFTSGLETFTYYTALAAVNSWSTYSVPLSFTGGNGWLGSSSAAFNNALLNVEQVTVGFFTEPNGAQTFRLDNFALEAGPTPGGSAVPEPGTMALMLTSGAALYFARRRLRFR